MAKITIKIEYINIFYLVISIDKIIYICYTAILS